MNPDLMKSVLSVIAEKRPRVLRSGVKQSGGNNTAPGYKWSDPTWKNPYPQVGSNEA